MSSSPQRERLCPPPLCSRGNPFPALPTPCGSVQRGREDELDGCVKLMFQPGEEIFGGAVKMIDAGLLENPKVDAAMAMHTALDFSPGSIGTGSGIVASSSDGFEIIIQGSGCHGAMPHEAIRSMWVFIFIRDLWN